MICCGIAASLFFFGHPGYVAVGQTWFHCRLLCAAHTFGIVVSVVTTSRPVVAASLCASEGCGEHLRTRAAVSERCNYWVRVFVFQFSLLRGSQNCLLPIKGRSQHVLCGGCSSQVRPCLQSRSPSRVASRRSPSLPTSRGRSQRMRPLWRRKMRRLLMQSAARFNTM